MRWAALGALAAALVGPGLARPSPALADGLSHIESPSADCTIFSGAPDDTSRCGAPSYNTIGVDGNGAYARTLIAFPAGLGIPAGSSVTDATLNINVIGTFGSTATWLFQLGRPFTAGAASWNSAGPGQPWSQPGGDANQPLQAAQQVGAKGAVAFSITSLVQSWVNGASPDLIMLPASPSGNAYTLDSVASGHGPTLVIAYQPPAATAPQPTTPQPTPIPTSTAPHALRVKLIFAWTWRDGVVSLRRATIGHFPGQTTLALRCAGRGCPGVARRHASGHVSVRRLLRRLVHARFRAGDLVSVTLSAPGYRSERAQLRIRRDRLPLVRPLSG